MIYFLEGRASQDGKRKRQHSRVNFFDGEAICTLGTISTVFFNQSPDCQRPRRLGPSTFELLTRPGPAAHLSSSISPGLFWTPGGPPPTRPGLERNSLHLLSASVFPLQDPQPILQVPQQRRWTPLGNTAVRTPTRRWFSKGNKGQLAGQPSQCGTTLFTQETELLFFFPLKTNKIYIYIYLFFHVELRQNKSVWSHNLWIPPTSN